MFPKQPYRVRRTIKIKGSLYWRRKIDKSKPAKYFEICNWSKNDIFPFLLTEIRDQVIIFYIIVAIIKIHRFDIELFGDSFSALRKARGQVF